MSSKNLLNAEATEKMMQRVEKLQPDSKPIWGKMSVTEMILHCNQVHEKLLAPAANHNKKTTPKQYLIRLLVLYVLPAFPKNAQAPAQLQTSGKASGVEFDEQKKKCLQLLQKFANYKQEIKHYHPYFGSLSTREWGLTSWKHLDHHLRQFGV